MGAANIERLLARPPLPEPERPETPSRYDVEFDRVTFSYDGVNNAVADIDAVCPPGRVTALVGPSGAGKTTLASLLPPAQRVRTARWLPRDGSKGSVSPA